MAKLIKTGKMKYANGGVSYGNAMEASSSLVNMGADVVDANRNSARPSMGVGIAKGAAQGAGVSAMLGGADFGASILIGGAIGGIKAKSDQKAYDKQAKLDYDARMNNIYAVNNNAMNARNMEIANSGFNGSGNINTFKQGGAIIKQGGKLQSLSNDTQLASGNTHEEGGIELSKSAEIEDGETVKDNGDELMIMSNNLVNPLTGRTYAKDDARLAKQLSKVENSTKPININAAKLISMKRERLEHMQQMMNGNSQGKV